MAMAMPPERILAGNLELKRLDRALVALGMPHDEAAPTKIKRIVLANYFLPTIHLSRLASNNPAISEEFRRKIALNYFRPSEYATVK
ncbi:MAG: hypothetical protein Q9178_006450 [Gyalolechia marmorata]